MLIQGENCSQLGEIDLLLNFKFQVDYDNQVKSGFLLLFYLEYVFFYYYFARLHYCFFSSFYFTSHRVPWLGMMWKGNVVLKSRKVQ